MSSPLPPELKLKADALARQLDVVIREQMRCASDYGAVVNIFGRPAAGKTLVSLAYCDLFGDATYLTPTSRLREQRKPPELGMLPFATIQAAHQVLFFDEPYYFADLGERLRRFASLLKGKVIVLITQRCVWEMDGLTPYLSKYRLDLAKGLRIVAGARIEKTANAPSMTVVSSPIAKYDFPDLSSSEEVSVSH